MASYNKQQESSSSPFESAISNLLKQHGGLHIVVDNAITPSDELIDRVLDYEEDSSSSIRGEESTEVMVGRALSLLQRNEKDSIEEERISSTTGGDAGTTCPHHKDTRWEASPTCTLLSPVRRLSHEIQIHHHKKGSRIISSPPLDVTMHQQSSKYY